MRDFRQPHRANKRVHATVSDMTLFQLVEEFATRQRLFDRVGMLSLKAMHVQNYRDLPVYKLCLYSSGRGLSLGQKRNRHHPQQVRVFSAKGSKQTAPKIKILSTIGTDTATHSNSLPRNPLTSHERHRRGRRSPGPGRHLFQLSKGVPRIPGRKKAGLPPSSTTIVTTPCHLSRTASCTSSRPWRHIARDAEGGAPSSACWQWCRRRSRASRLAARRSHNR